MQINPSSSLNCPVLWPSHVSRVCIPPYFIHSSHILELDISILISVSSTPISSLCLIYHPIRSPVQSQSLFFSNILTPKFFSFWLPTFSLCIIRHISSPASLPRLKAMLYHDSLAYHHWFISKTYLGLTKPEAYKINSSPMIQLPMYLT